MRSAVLLQIALGLAPFLAHVAAEIIPARRAGKLNVLEALQYE